MKDPVCGMNITEESTFAFKEWNGTRYGFCSQHCYDSFSQQPEKYVKPHESSEHHHDHEHMHDHSHDTLTKSVHNPDVPECCSPAGSAAGTSRHDVVKGDTKSTAIYTCPMHSDVRQEGPGSCPKCGMALELLAPVETGSKTEYVCPMHPEIVKDEPGNCPICGMTLEPKTVTDDSESNPELIDMTRRFWISTVLSIPLVLLTMAFMFTDKPLIPGGWQPWIELLLATPVVLWGGAPFFVRGWNSIVTRNLNMFTLIGIGTGVAYGYSLIATFFPDIFPDAFRGHEGIV
ncbi:MAG: YHS domain-containing protein, partial [Planctomycetia bacterium]|nr:YHS domain-containing protein [Planctomycetia bacterium]